MLMDVLSLIGAAAVGTGILILLVAIGKELKKIHRVAKHYHETAPISPYGSNNLFKSFVHAHSEIRKRLYVAERDGRNACYRISEHAKDYKHTKTAKKVAIDKERKKREQEYQHDHDVRGGDGM